MNIDTDVQAQPEPQYEDSIEGKLQFFADRALWYKSQADSAKTNMKRELYMNKLRKNNQKMWTLLVRTPNEYNPLMKYLTGDAKPSEESQLEPTADTETGNQ